jgi:rubrerythrin
MLESAREFERRLEAYYAELRDRSTNDGARLLTYYLARHRKHLPEALESLPAPQLEGLCRVRLQSEMPEFHLPGCFRGKDLPASASGDELLGVAIELVETLAAFYRSLAERLPEGEAHELAEELLHIEEVHLIELKKTKATHYF